MPFTGKLGTVNSEPENVVPMFGAGGTRYAQALSGQLSFSGSITSALTHAFRNVSLTVYRAVFRAYARWSTYAPIVMGDHPVGYWRLGDPSGALTAFDSSGFANLGTLHGTVTLGILGGLKDNSSAMQFDGSTGYVDIPATAWNPSKSNLFSIEALVKPTTIDTAFRRVGGRESVTNHGALLYWQSAAGWGFLRGDSSAGNDVATGGTPSTSAFSHVVGTYDGTNMRLYVNGVLVATTPSTRLVDVGAADLYAGGTVANLNGAAYIEEFSVYAYALTAQQVTTHYTAVTTYPLAGFTSSLRTSQ